MTRLINYIHNIINRIQDINNNYTIVKKLGADVTRLINYIHNIINRIQDINNNYTIVKKLGADVTQTWCGCDTNLVRM